MPQNLSQAFNHLMQERCNQGLSNKGLLAISGGVDSMVLLDLMAKASTQIRLKLHVAHMNFDLRGEESAKDAELVEKACEKYGIPFHLKKVDTKAYMAANKLGVQEAARNLRFEWFDDLLQENNLKWIATAHHSDDQAETVLMNLLRGSGTNGLSGMYVLSEKRLKPMLFFSKAAIRKYAGEENIVYREDASNASTKYTRNQVRHDILPALEKVKRGATKGINRTALLMKDADYLMRDFCERFLRKNEKNDGIPVHKLYSSGVHFSILHYWMRHQNPSFGQIEELDKLMSSQSGSKVQFRDGYVLMNREHLQWVENEEGFQAEEESNAKDLPIVFENDLAFMDNDYFGLHTEQAENPLNSYRIEVDFIPFPLTLRRWQAGDRIKPKGMKGSQKVSDILTQAKVPMDEKKDVLVLEDNSGEIIWVCGYKIGQKEAAHGDYWLEYLPNTKI